LFINSLFQHQHVLRGSVDLTFKEVQNSTKNYFRTTR